MKIFISFIIGLVIGTYCLSFFYPYTRTVDRKVIVYEKIGNDEIEKCIHEKDGTFMAWYGDDVTLGETYGFHARCDVPHSIIPI